MRKEQGKPPRRAAGDACAERLGVGRHSSACAGNQKLHWPGACFPSCPATFRLAPAYFLRLSARALGPPPPRGPNAFGQRATPDRKWPLWPSAPGRGKRFLLLTASKIASRFLKTPVGKRARSGAVKRRRAFLLFPSLICQSLAGKPTPQGSLHFPKMREVPKTAFQGRRRPDRPRLEPVRRHAELSGTSRPSSALRVRRLPSRPPRKSGFGGVSNRVGQWRDRGAPPLSGREWRQELATCTAFWDAWEKAQAVMSSEVSVPWCYGKVIDVSDLSTFLRKHVSGLYQRES